MYKILGWTNAIITIVLFLPFAASAFVKNKEGTAGKIVKSLKKLHRPLGASLAVLSLTHGFLALGSLALHTGTIVGLMVLITAIAGVLFISMKKKKLFALHRVLAFVFGVLLIVHLLVPSLF